MPDPSGLLDIALKTASEAQTNLTSEDTAKQVEFVCRNPNRSGTRFLMACLLAKVHNPEVDIRKPYTAIGDDDAYSGRRYDEDYVYTFIVKHDLPCNPTTAFLTPAFRNRDVMLTPHINLEGRPPQLYEILLHLLNDIDRALQKIANSDKKIDNYIFITTDVIEREIREYAASIYERTGGIEMVILDCIGFLRHFLHLFHRIRMQFLDEYQALLLAEPVSAVRQELKEAFLALRRAASSSENG